VIAAPASDDLGSIFEANAISRPDERATIFAGRTRTWRELHERSNQLANRLLAEGVERGDRVAVASPTSDLVAETLAALAKVGVVAVPINPGLTVPEMTFIFNDARPRVALVHPTCVGAVGAAIADHAEPPALVGLAEADELDATYEEWIAGADAGDPPVRAEPDDVQVVMWTSGTTGVPKGCLLTQRGTRIGLESYLRTVDVPRDGPTMMIAPFFVGVGNFQLFAMARAGIASVIVPRFDAGEVLHAIEEHSVAHGFVVATALLRLSEHPRLADYDISSLRLIGYGGSPIASHVVRRGIAALGCDFYQCYGATEAGGFISFLLPSDHRAAVESGSDARLSSAGRPAPHLSITIRDQGGAPVPTGTLGEIVVETETHFVGYLGRPELTSSVLSSDEVRTGDIGRLDEDGYLSVVDRMNDVIITGGMNVAPSEVESVLHKHPDVAQVAVIGVPDAEWGEAVKAVVRLRPGGEPDEAHLLAFARKSLAGYKTPKSVDFIDELPVSPAGKLLRRQLREPYWAGQERRI
jgi:acyl-CoA synthetase (AMP-forming)/AMP-acid ligase II